MARAHGRVLSSIWEDEDFIALTQQQQRLYLFLISQPNLNHAGLLPLTLRRWARKATGLTAAELDEHLDALAKAHFIVLDVDTEELLIRSFVRNDGVWRMPKVMGAMVSGAMEIESKALRRALLEEMDRVPLNDLSDEPTKSTRGPGPSVRAQVAEHIATLRKAFGNPHTTPPEGGSTSPSAPPSGTPSDTPAEGGRKPSTRARAGAHVRAAPSPAPAPTPAPAPSLSPAADATSTPVAEPQDERETSSDQPATYAQQAIRATGLLDTNDETTFLAWIADTHKPRSTGWWKTVTANGDLPDLIAEWREQRGPGLRAVPDQLPPWCGQCGNGNPAAEFNPKFRTTTSKQPCPDCHPTTQSATAA
ncbi:MAG: hypothetical protein ABFE07_18480 [Armatimonadia bacterium]